MLWLALVFISGVDAFQSIAISKRSLTPRLVKSTTVDEDQKAKDEARTAVKEKLLEVLNPKPTARTEKSSIFIDRLTKEPLTMELEASSPNKMMLLTGDRTWVRREPTRKILLRSSENSYVGYSDSYYDLLEPFREETDGTNKSNFPLSPETSRRITQALVPLLPPPLRSSLSTLDPDFLPMRDLFTNPAVSFAYERGWRQGFAQAGFPGVEREAELANDYFAPVVASNPSSSVLVDMSCATGLFTRRFADSKAYGRVLGCDYSPSMLEEAIRRRPPTPGSLDWVRLDVGDMPFADESIDVLHAGAAMHCWPELDKAASEIYRVLKPSGRYFATTFLSSYFSNLQSMDGASNPSQFAFQYFQSVDQLRALMESGGFEAEKIQIEVMGTACVVIRCEK